MTFEGYETGAFYDELFHADGTPRPEARPLVERIERLAEGELARSQQAAARALLRMSRQHSQVGTFAVSRPRRGSTESSAARRHRRPCRRFPMVEVGGDETAFAERYGAPTRSNVIEFLTIDRTNPNSIASCVAAARENARTVREIISSEVWQEINEFYLDVTAPEARQFALHDAVRFFGAVTRTSHVVTGTRSETMEHGEAWNFSRLGRFIERADQTSRILDVKYFLLLPSAADVGRPVDDLQWSALLRSASGFEAYRRTWGLVSRESVVAFLLFDRAFPRSVGYCVTQAHVSLHAVTGTPMRRFANRAEQLLGRLASELDYTDAGEVIGGGLHEFIDALQDRFNQVGGTITATFFRQG